MIPTLHPRRHIAFCLLLGALCGTTLTAMAAEPVSLFDGRTFNGWEGDTNKTWSIRDGTIVGGSLTTQIPRNEFLATTRPYTNFVLELDFKLVGTEGFINAGIQLRSQRVTDPANEMCGYQADIGDGWWGTLYDESRRNRPLVKPTDDAIAQAMHPGEWNRYRIRCEGRRIRTWINDVPLIDYTEPDLAIPQEGLIGLQIHGGAKAEIAYRNLTLQEL